MVQQIKNDKPGFNAIELCGMNYSVIVRSIDPEEPLEDIGDLALSLYRKLMAIEGAVR